MELLAILAALAALAIPVTVVVLVFKVAALSRRLTDLERRHVDLAGRSIPAAVMPRVGSDRVDDRIVTPPPATPVADLPDAADPGAVPVDPWSGAPAAAAPVAPPDMTSVPAADRPVVVSRERASALGDWLKANWVYAISALSLAFAGVFFVQYGMENGLLPPPARVIMALLFGLALIAAGEFIRRRSGDGAKSATAYLPSTFAGAGIVSMFAGVLAARQLYDLIGTGTAFGGLAAVSALALVIGWYYGPFLAAVGLIGAGIAPFAVGGSSESIDPLYAYFCLIAALGLGIDAARRWAWVSVLALGVGYGGLFLVAVGGGAAGYAALALALLAVLAILVPCLRLAPDHDGPMVAEAVLTRGRAGWPIFPTRLAAGAMALSVLGLVLQDGPGEADSLIAFLCLALLAGVVTFWSARARALSDLALLPAAGFLARLALEGAGFGPMARSYADKAVDLRLPEVGPPQTAALLLGLGVVMSLIAAWRSGRGDMRASWGAAAALIAPLAAVGLEFFWAPSSVLGAYPWALHVIALAALMAFLASRFAAADGEERRRAAYATLSTLALIALAFGLVLTKAALTLALAALIPVAALLDRRFRLPEMGWFIQAAVMALSYRLVVDPGLMWAVWDAGPADAILAYGGASAAMLGALRLIVPEERRNARVFLESGGAAALALFVNVMVLRQFDDESTLSHWALTLNSMPWLVLALVQLYRLQLGGALRWLRWVIASVAGLIALGGLGLSALPANPLFGLLDSRGWVRGPVILDSLLVAYLIPGLMLIVAARRLDHLPRWLSLPMQGLGIALAALYAGLEIRRLWRGPDLSVYGVTQPELYSYTIALMVLGAALLYQAIARRSGGLRRIAMAVIALTIAKVFLIDASGLSGLTRVFSFLALGLALAGLAWLNRWAAERQEEGPQETSSG
ncbi:DUF2339 domain-containing protein [Frigidibacter sp. RF13]|uniref:DUF2339 domain-containing protein n=1 Tax=Frigidibacter sp. RF13 TaxID=2997340 RepID=UPI00226FBA22|nr:DUF2339 domain-containing protein [Frigidibacter sp. RF13]MCY1126957.1 DUF2339 domain-containing protein [Frigidibacter sp. RF13]